MAVPAVFRFPPFVVDPAKRLLLSDGVPVPLTPKAFDTLLMLLEHRERVLSKHELMRKLWPDTSVEESTLSQHVFMVRKALSGADDSSEYIATIPRRGYRFVKPLIDDAPVGDAAIAMRSGQPAARLFLVFCGVALLGLVLARVVPFDRSNRRAQSIRTVIPTPDNATPVKMSDEVESPPIISPDGRHIAFVAESADGYRRVWLRDLDSMAAAPLSWTESVSALSPPFWSPDARALGVFADGKLKRVDLGGGPATVLCDAPDARGGTWSPSGIIVFAPVPGGGLFRVDAARGGVAQPVTTPRGEHDHRWPAFLPDGHHLLYVATADRRQDERVVLIDLSAPETAARVVADGSTNAAYASGYLLFTRGTALLAQPFDAARFTLTGTAAVVAERVAYSTSMRYGAFSASETGVLTYRTGRARNTQLLWYRRDGQVLGSVGPPGEQTDVAVAPDQISVAFRRVDAYTHRTELWIRRTDRAAMRLAVGHGHAGTPLWSPDGLHVVYGSNMSGSADNPPGLFRVSASGQGTDERMLTVRSMARPTSWSPDGRSLVFEDQDPVTKLDLWVVPVVGKPEPMPLVRSPGNDAQGQVSPDGRWLAFTSDESGKAEVYVQAFPAATERWQVSTSGGTHPRWRRDGRELFYVGPDQMLMAVRMSVANQGLDFGTRLPLFKLPPNPADIVQAYTAAPDGQRFLVNAMISGRSDEWVIVVNWDGGIGP
jgi:DNA-binding winged helix-turn-helix (wHTH) protein/Tol biopolymer transport system component